jgi:hypothetical protein
MSIKKGKDTRAHQSLRLLPELERRLDSTPDRASPALLLLNQNLYKWRTISRVWSLNFHYEGGIYRAEWDIHRLREVGLAPGGGQPAGWSGLLLLR